MIKNRHNQENTEKQSGKTEFSIADLLPVGKENAISTAELVQATGCSSARELQQYIALERKAGAVICSSTTGGYFLPVDHGEIAEFCKVLENRAKNTFIAIQSARSALRESEWQQEINSSGREYD